MSNSPREENRRSPTGPTGGRERAGDEFEVEFVIKRSQNPPSLSLHMERWLRRTQSRDLCPQSRWQEVRSAWKYTGTLLAWIQSASIQVVSTGVIRYFDIELGYIQVQRVGQMIKRIVRYSGGYQGYSRAPKAIVSDETDRVSQRHPSFAV